MSAKRNQDSNSRIAGSPLIHRACFSDVGQRFVIQSSQRGGELIRAALRASDILMDRVWQLDRVRIEWDAKGEGPHIAMVDILKTTEKSKAKEDDERQ
jgi:hypothetical protein